ncbi:MAG: hypothetical protein ACFB2Z_08625 [Maricaulaceae bacterium]
MPHTANRLSIFKLACLAVALSVMAAAPATAQTSRDRAEGGADWLSFFSGGQPRAGALDEVFGVTLAQPLEASGVAECPARLENQSPQEITDNREAAYERCLERARKDRRGRPPTESQLNQCRRNTRNGTGLTGYAPASEITDACWRRCTGHDQCAIKYTLTASRTPESRAAAEQAQRHALEAIGVDLNKANLDTPEGFAEILRAAQALADNNSRAKRDELRAVANQIGRNEILQQTPLEEPANANFGGYVIRRVQFGADGLPEFVNGDPVFLMDADKGVAGVSMLTHADRREEALDTLIAKYGQPSKVDETDEVLRNGQTVAIDTYFWERGDVVVRFLPVRSDTISYCCFVSYQQKSFTVGELDVYTREAYAKIFGAPTRRRAF